MTAITIVAGLAGLAIGMVIGGLYSLHIRAVMYAVVAEEIPKATRAGRIVGLEQARNLLRDAGADDECIEFINRYIAWLRLNGLDKESLKSAPILLNRSLQ